MNELTLADFLGSIWFGVACAGAVIIAALWFGVVKWRGKRK
jgi:hypothetical protein